MWYVREIARNMASVSHRTRPVSAIQAIMGRRVIVPRRHVQVLLHAVIMALATQMELVRAIPDGQE